GLIFVALCLDLLRSSPLPNSSRSRSDHASGIGSPALLLQSPPRCERPGRPVASPALAFTATLWTQDAKSSKRRLSNDGSTSIDAHSGGKETSYNGNLGTLFQPTCPIYPCSSY